MNTKEHKYSFLLGILVVALVLLFISTGCDRNNSHQDKAYQEKTGMIEPVTADKLKALIGSHKGNPVLVNVWATWCQPCVEEFPDLMEVANKYNKEGLELILVTADFKDRIKKALTFLAKQGVTGTSYRLDGDENAFVNGMNPDWSGALPATFVYNRDGNLADFWEGKADKARFEKAVIKVLK